MFNDFDFELENEAWFVSIHDSHEDDSIIVVDALLKSDYERLGDDGDIVDIINQMLIKSKEVLEMLLVCCFGFEDSDVNEALNAIEKISFNNEED